MLSRLHGRDDHCRVECRRRADVDDVDASVGEKRTPIALGHRDPMAFGEALDRIAPRGDGDLHGEPVDALIGLHMKLGGETAADQPDPHQSPSPAL
jgi:hypothetical protein